MAQYGATGTEYFLTDALGSVRQMLDAEGEIKSADISQYCWLVENYRIRCDVNSSDAIVSRVTKREDVSCRL